MSDAAEAPLRAAAAADTVGAAPIATGGIRPKLAKAESNR